MVKLNIMLIVAVTLVTIPTVALAQTPRSPRSPRSPQSPGPQSPGQIIQQQQSRIEQIQKDAVAQIEALLTPEQLRQYKGARLYKGEGPFQALESIQNISDEQQEQINDIMRKTSRQIIDATPR
ncbi:MAG TPA: hypothetical protein V6D14_03855 [Coleofasciculaceae cyanobacterium]|jgi:hypothetical protein